MASPDRAPLHDPTVRSFASDNYAGAHDEVLAAMAAANGGHVASYGADPWTERLGEVAAGHFGEGTEVFPVFNGTGANVVSLQALLPRWGGVVCASTAHINCDEGAAPERVAGIKLLTVDSPDGKLTPELVDRQAWGFDDEHRAMPAVVSLTQSSEVGTVYTPDELRALCDHAHERGMAVHVDGARLANAAAALGTSLRALTSDVGIDAVSLGGTKNGALFAEAVLLLRPEAAPGVVRLRKMGMQLGSKMRFLSAQLLALFEGDLWLRSAAHANAMAARLSSGLAPLPGVELTQATEANGVFVALPAGVADTVRRHYRFYDWDRTRGEVRLMCAWDTTVEDVDGLVAAVASALEQR